MCTRISIANKQPDGSLLAVGGEDAWGSRWGLTIADMVTLIESGEWAFFVAEPPNDRVEVVVAERNGRKYIKTTADGDMPNNLLSLPDRQPALTNVRPGLFAGLPGARKPQLVSVRRAPTGSTPVTALPRMNGAFPVLPGGFYVRVTAPWPAELEVKVDNAVLQRAPAGTTTRPDLDAQDVGWYTVDLTNPDRMATTWDVFIVPAPSKRRGPRLVLTIASVSSNPNCLQAHAKSMPLVVRLDRGAPRRNVWSLTIKQRQDLQWFMSAFLTDAVVAAHLQITHTGEHLLTGHRGYIEELETFLLGQGPVGRAFVPLPKWDPAQPIPPEFYGIRPLDAGGLSGRPPLTNFDPQLPLPAAFAPGAVCTHGSATALGNAIDGWHGQVHTRVGGTMADITISSAAIIFWFWHAFVDDVFWEWQRCP